MTAMALDPMRDLDGAPVFTVAAGRRAGMLSGHKRRAVVADHVVAVAIFGCRVTEWCRLIDGHAGKCDTRPRP